MFFDEWIIGSMGARYLNEFQDAVELPLDYRFLKGASGLAREVLSSGYKWRHASGVYAVTGRELGLDDDTIARLLGQAWYWAHAGYNHWMDLTRAWICLFDDDMNFYHLPTKEVVSDLDFGALFETLSPVADPEWPLVPFLIDTDLIILVNRVTRVLDRDRGFFETSEGLFFNET